MPLDETEGLCIEELVVLQVNNTDDELDDVVIPTDEMELLVEVDEDDDEDVQLALEVV